MAEIKLLIKPEFEQQAVDKFTNDINKKIGSGGSGSSKIGKETKKQTTLLEGIFKFAKIGALLNAPKLGIDLVGAGRSLAGAAAGAAGEVGRTQTSDLAQSLELGTSINKEAAERLRNGERMVDVLDKETVLQEYAEQKILNQLTGSEKSARVMRTLEGLWVDINLKSGTQTSLIQDINTAANNLSNEWDSGFNSKLDKSISKLKTIVSLTKEAGSSRGSNDVSSGGSLSTDFTRSFDDTAPTTPISSTLLNRFEIFTLNN